jgi:hypothetical protein
MATIADLYEVLITQAIYIIILGLITYGVKKTGRKQGFLYWFIVSVNILYGLSFGWLFYEYSSFRNNPDSGRVFAWVMFSAIVPGILVFASLVSFFASRVRRRRRTLLTAILIIIVAGIIYREHFQRVLIAIVIYRGHTFTPPLKITNESLWPRFWSKAKFYWDLSALRVAREKRLKQFNPSLKPLLKEVNRKQSEGEGMSYSMHIYREIRWLLNFTPDTTTTRLRIEDLRKSLSQPEAQKLTSEQLASDGSWGYGINVWYLKLYYSVDHLEDSVQPQYPLRFLDRINSPEKLKVRLDSLLYDDFTKTGIFNREELDETFSAIARLLHKSKLRAYDFHPQLDSALRDYVKNWQNPSTGCWGQWMVDRSGDIWKMDDVGMTFHVISDFHGQVEHKDLIAKRLLQLDDLDFPAGIKFNGHFENHLNWDAVRIFRYSWPFLDAATREKVRLEISKLLAWCLTNSYQPDGSFKISDLDDTMEDAYRYGVAFLSETGYFENKNRFWTNQDFPEAKSVHNRIEAKLLSIGLKSSGLRDAYETLNGKRF